MSTNKEWRPKTQETPVTKKRKTKKKNNNRQVWVFLGGLFLVATIGNSASASKDPLVIPEAPAPIYNVNIPVPTSAPPTTTTTAPNRIVVEGDDNGDGFIDESESGWKCETMGNKRCDDAPATTTTTVIDAEKDSVCSRTTFTDGSFVNVRKTGDGTYEKC